MVTEEQIANAVARLEADVQTAERRLTDLETRVASARAALEAARHRREGAEAFLAYVTGADSSGDAAPARPGESVRGANTGLNSVLRVYVQDREAGAVIDLTGAMADPRIVATGASREQVRNGFHYLGKQGVVRSAGRGQWVRSTDTSAPVATGAEVGGELSSDSLLVEGGPANGAEPLRGDDPTAFAAQDGRAHDLRASVMEVTG